MGHARSQSSAVEPNTLISRFASLGLLTVGRVQEHPLDSQHQLQDCGGDAQITYCTSGVIGELRQLVRREVQVIASAAYLGSVPLNQNSVFKTAR